MFKSRKHWFVMSCLTLTKTGNFLLNLFALIAPALFTSSRLAHSSIDVHRMFYMCKYCITMHHLTLYEFFWANQLSHRKLKWIWYLSQESSSSSVGHKASNSCGPQLLFSRYNAAIIELVSVIEISLSLVGS